MFFCNTMMAGCWPIPMTIVIPFSSIPVLHLTWQSNNAIVLFGKQQVMRVLGKYFKLCDKLLNQISHYTANRAKGSYLNQGLRGNCNLLFVLTLVLLFAYQQWTHCCMHSSLMSILHSDRHGHLQVYTSTVLKLFHIVQLELKVCTVALKA